MVEIESEQLEKCVLCRPLRTSKWLCFPYIPVSCTAYEPRPLLGKRSIANQISKVWFSLTLTCRRWTVPRSITLASYWRCTQQIVPCIALEAQGTTGAQQDVLNTADDFAISKTLVVGTWRNCGKKMRNWWLLCVRLDKMATAEQSLHKHV